MTLIVDQQVIDCLKNLCRNHNTLVVTSIHQPSNHLFLKFDSIFVLGKEGVCLYNGRPENLKTSLFECNIECNELQVPIEVLLEISSEGMSDKRVFKLYENNYSKYSELREFCEKQMILSSNGIKQKPKTFKFLDFWNLLLRAMIYTYFSQFSSLLIHWLFFVTFGIFFSISYNEGIGKLDGCFSLATIFEMSCKEIAEEKGIIEENVYFIYTSSLVFLVIQISITTSLFLKEIKIFKAEHQNSKNYMHLLKLVL